MQAGSAAHRKRQICAPAAPARGWRRRQSESVVKLDKVEVTGSNIRRIEGESGLPVQVITREELQIGGVQTMQELLDVSAPISPLEVQRGKRREEARWSGSLPRRSVASAANAPWY